MITRYAYGILVMGLALPSLAMGQAEKPGIKTVVTNSGPGSGSKQASPAKSPAISPDSVFVNPDVRPQFVGGEPALRAYMAKNMRYPEKARQQKVTGKVFIRFVLSTEGRVTDASFVRGPGSGLNEEALRLVWMMPAWQPGYQHGQAVRVVCTLPIEFEL